ncbi:MAG: hypothetical protein GX078_09125 [Clostridiales bacterium]|nr:hypothetical protein [Clostridiales bacterium]
MQKRKFEFWKYDATMCKEAAKHLNDMSREGYELTGISKPFSLAGYRKAEILSNKRYTVIINDTSKDYEEDNLIYFDKREGTSIYEGDFTDYNEDESFNHLKNNILRKQKNDSPLDLIFLVVAFYRGFPRNFSSLPYIEYFSSLLLWIAVLVIVLAGRITRLINRREYVFLEGFNSFENLKSRKYKPYRKRSKLIPYLLAILLTATFSVSLLMLMTSVETYMSISTIVVLMGISMVILSLYFILITRNPEIEKGLLVVGSSLTLLGFLFMNSPVGINIALLMYVISLL